MLLFLSKKQQPWIHNTVFVNQENMKWAKTFVWCLLLIFLSCIQGSFDTVTSLCMGFHCEKAAAGLGPSGLTARLLKIQRYFFPFQVSKTDDKVNKYNESQSRTQERLTSTMSSSQLKVGGGGTQTCCHTSYYIGALPETDSNYQKKKKLNVCSQVVLTSEKCKLLPHPE